MSKEICKMRNKDVKEIKKFIEDYSIKKGGIQLDADINELINKVQDILIDQYEKPIKPKFRYNQKVKAYKGFFKGQTGKIIAYKKRFNTIIYYIFQNKYFISPLTLQIKEEDLTGKT